MSAIARAHVLPVDRLPELRAAIPTQKRFLRAPIDRFEGVLSELGRVLPDFAFSGYVVAVALPFLDERQIHLMNAPSFESLAREICDARSVSAFFLTLDHRERYLDVLGSNSFEAPVLRAYFDEFNACQEPDAGEWMLAAISYLQSVLQSLRPGEVALLQIG